MSANSRGTFLGAFRFAGRGVLAAALTQRNMRLHLVAAVLVATFGSAFPLGVAERLALVASVVLVVAAEVLNTALEAAVDLAGGQPDERARVAKDAAAGFVLVLSVGAAAAFALVVVGNWGVLRSGWRDSGRTVALGLSIAALSAWLVFPFRRPAWLDRLAALLGAALCVPLALVSRSLVFAVVAALALGVCAAAALARHPRMAGQGSGPARWEGPRVPLPVWDPDDERPDPLSPAAPPPRRTAR